MTNATVTSQRASARACRTSGVGGVTSANPTTGDWLAARVAIRATVTWPTPKDPRVTRFVTMALCVYHECFYLEAGRKLVFVWVLK